MSDIEILVVAVVAIFVARVLTVAAVENGAPGILFGMAQVVSFVVATIYAVKIILPLL